MLASGICFDTPFPHASGDVSFGVSGLRGVVRMVPPSVLLLPSRRVFAPFSLLCPPACLKK